MVRSGQQVTIEFPTRRFDTGVTTNADALPTAVLVVNGTNNSAVVSISSVATGRYKASVLLPTLSDGDIVEIVAFATVNAVSDQAVVWRDACEVRPTNTIWTSDSGDEVQTFLAADSPSYCDRLTASAYFAKRLNTGDWDSASPQDQDKALSQATSMIDQLNFAGDVAVDGQPLQFPRDDDTVIPQAVAYACAEVAIALLGDVDVNMEGRGVNVTETSFANVRTKKNETFVQDWVLAGIPSPMAWNYLKPFLRDPHAVDLVRV